MQSRWVLAQSRILRSLGTVVQALMPFSLTLLLATGCGVLSENVTDMNSKGVSLTLSTVVSVPEEIFADGFTTATITVTLVDDNGVPIVGKKVALISDHKSTDIITPDSVATNDKGKAIFRIKSSVAQKSEIKAILFDESTTLKKVASINFKNG